MPARVAGKSAREGSKKTLKSQDLLCIGGIPAQENGRSGLVRLRTLSVPKLESCLSVCLCPIQIPLVLTYLPTLPANPSQFVLASQIVDVPTSSSLARQTDFFSDALAANSNGFHRT